MNVKRLCGFALALLLAFRCMALPAAASGRFADVPADSVYGESVPTWWSTGLRGEQGNHCYCPERPVTVSEWAVLLFRALDGSGLDSYPSDKQAEFCIQQCYQKGWLDVREVLSPETVLCRGNLLLSAFRAFGLPVYDSTLYGDAPMSPPGKCAARWPSAGAMSGGSVPIRRNDPWRCCGAAAHPPDPNA